MRQLEGTREDIAFAIALEDEHAGNPRRGTHIGPGPHTDMPATWDGTGATPNGWSRTYATPRKHPTRNRWSMPMHDAAHEARLAGATLPSGRRVVNRTDFSERAPDWDAEEN